MTSSQKGILCALALGLVAIVARPAAAQCPPVTGACCLPTGECANLTAADCGIAGGVYNGDNSDCGSLCSPCDIETYNFVNPPIGPPPISGPSTGGTLNGGQVNISGATLFVDFLRFPGAYNDAINVDNDMISTNAADCSMPPFVPYAGFISGLTCNFPVDRTAMTAAGGVGYDCSSAFAGHWLVNYRSVGSVEGLQEFVDFQVASTLPVGRFPTERGMVNGVDYYRVGVGFTGVASCRIDHDCDGDITLNDESGLPYYQQSVDMSSTDVPTLWGVRGPAGAAAPLLKPGQPGYGLNPGASYPNNGIDNSGDTGHLLVNFSGLNLNTAMADGATVFDTTIAWSPVCVIANRGTGRDRIRYTEMQHLLVTGRSPSGENYQAVTRDKGSGTRNTHNNGFGIDPSQGVGDNLGPRIVVAEEARCGIVPDVPGLVLPIGGDTQPTNCGGSGILEDAVQNRRLAIGYTGLFGSSRAADDTRSGRYEILATCKDIDGNGDLVVDSDCTPDAGDGAPGHLNWTPANPISPPRPGTCPSGLIPADYNPANDGYVRPSLAAVLDNDNPRTGYQVSAAQTLGTRGDPNAGIGPNINPAMCNLVARDFIRNITGSIAAFVAVPGAPASQLMPAQVLADNFALVAAVDAITFNSNPTDLRPAPVFVQALQDYVRCNNIASVYAFGTVNVAGLVPIRNDRVADSGATPTLPPGGTYSDGSANGRYKDFAGAFTVIGNTHRLNRRNLIAGDFNNDGLRNVNDISQMMFALNNRNAYVASQGISAGTGGGASGTPTFDDFVIPEVIGDYNADGDFNAEDARYFADGLALIPATGTLNRKVGFTEVDLGWACQMPGDNNYFNTTLATAAPYKPGDSRADVAGSAAGPFPGAFPNGHDLVVDARDIDYVYNNFGNWAVLTQADTMDLSCDMNGDLVVNQLDVDQVVRHVLGTEYGDVNLDGDVDAADRAVVVASIATPPAVPGWANGDVNGDNAVTPADLAIVDANLGFSGPDFFPKYDCDMNNDGATDCVDRNLFVDVLLGVNTTCSARARADLNLDGAANGADAQAFVTCYIAATGATGCVYP